MRMNRLVMCLALLLTVPGIVEARQADDEAAVLAVVRTLFDGMREHDEAKLLSVWHPEARLQNAGRDREGNLRVSSTPIESFVSSMASMTAVVNEVTFDEEVRVDGDLATAWTPYNVFVDGEFRHCGVDAFVMARTEEGWKILQLTDTRHAQGCDPERGGND